MNVLPFPTDIPPRVGRLLTADRVASELFSGTVSGTWVRRHLEAGRVRLGHRTVVWEETTVRRWIAQQVEAA